MKPKERNSITQHTQDKSRRQHGSKRTRRSKEATRQLGVTLCLGTIRCARFVIDRMRRTETACNLSNLQLQRKNTRQEAAALTRQPNIAAASWPKAANDVAHFSVSSEPSISINVCLASERSHLDRRRRVRTRIRALQTHEMVMLRFSAVFVADVDARWGAR